MKKEYKKYFDKHILTKSILLSGLVTCEEQINKYAYMEKKWKNRYESNDPVYYESYKACRLEWMGMREKIQAVLQKNQYFMSQIVQMVKGEEYRLPQKDVRAIVALIDSGEYEYRESKKQQVHIRTGWISKAQQNLGICLMLLWMQCRQFLM